MSGESQRILLDAFHNAASRVPAYRVLLQESGVPIATVRSIEDFKRLPIIGKKETFQRFNVRQLCLDGELGNVGTVLTSSGHSGIFAFGVSNTERLNETVEWIDDSLDMIFSVRSRRTMLVNCLPMGVKVPTRACTLAETSVRPDMVVALVRSFGAEFDQVILVGEAAFVKHVVELGRRAGLKWSDHRIHVILGEEPLAENARRYIGGILGHDLREPERGVVLSSMGIAEVGLNLFFEAPPTAPLVLLRSLMHDDAQLRQAVLGPRETVPSLFYYDPRRIFVEFDAQGRLVLTTLDPRTRIPLIRYAPGDHGFFLTIPDAARAVLAAKGIPLEALEQLPMVAIEGRNEQASSGNGGLFPEAVKEGIYADPALAELTTANFRITSGRPTATIHIQLSPGVQADPNHASQFTAAISRYVRAAFDVSCHPYDTFPWGMAVDYERKFRYLEAGS